MLTSNSLNLPTATALLWEAGRGNVIIKKDGTTCFQHFVQVHLLKSIQYKPRYYNTKACWRCSPSYRAPIPWNHPITFRLWRGLHLVGERWVRSVRGWKPKMTEVQKSSKKWLRFKVWDSMIKGPKIVDRQGSNSELLGVTKITDDRGLNRETQRSQRTRVFGDDRVIEAWEEEIRLYWELLKIWSWLLQSNELFNKFHF